MELQSAGTEIQSASHVDRRCRSSGEMVFRIESGALGSEAQWWGDEASAERARHVEVEKLDESLSSERSLRPLRFKISVAIRTNP